MLKCLVRAIKVDYAREYYDCSFIAAAICDVDVDVDGFYTKYN